MISLLVIILHSWCVFISIYRMACYLPGIAPWLAYCLSKNDLIWSCSLAKTDQQQYQYFPVWVIIVNWLVLEVAFFFGFKTGLLCVFSNLSECPQCMYLQASLWMNKGPNTKFQQVWITRMGLNMILTSDPLVNRPLYILSYCLCVYNYK